MSSRIDLLKPENLNDSEISSWFTLRNHLKINSGNRIPGLNLGLNTDESVSEVLANRELMAEKLHIDSDRIAFAVQIHKTDVQVIEQAGIYDNTDSMVTSTSGMALAIQVADCAAVLLGDPENKVIGAAHAGWRGAAGGVLINTIQAMKKLGARSDQIKAFISPCISLKNFEVGDEVAAEFPDQFVDRTHFKKPHVDLKGFLKWQLKEEGIEEPNILVNEHCTKDNENYYSYRRQKDKSGRMMGIIKLN